MNTIAFSPPFPFCPCKKTEDDRVEEGSLYPFKMSFDRALKWFWRVKRWRIEGVVAISRTTQGSCVEDYILNANVEAIVDVADKIDSMEKLACCRGQPSTSLECHSWLGRPTFTGNLVHNKSAECEGGESSETFPITNDNGLYSLDMFNHVYGNCGILVDGGNYLPKFIFSFGIDKSPNTDYFLTTHIPDENLEEGADQFTEVGQLLVIDGFLAAVQTPLYMHLASNQTYNYNIGFSIYAHELWPIPGDEEDE